MEATMRAIVVAAAVERVSPIVFREKVDRPADVLNDAGSADDATD